MKLFGLYNIVHKNCSLLVLGIKHNIYLINNCISSTMFITEANVMPMPMVQALVPTLTNISCVQTKQDLLGNITLMAIHLNRLERACMSNAFLILNNEVLYILE